MFANLSHLRTRISALIGDREGTVSLEYILIGGLVSLGFAAAASTLAGSIGTTLGHIGTYLTGITMG
jgi:Flp pilus assembly pilin Flp